MTNEEILKTIETSDFLNGGLLNPKQQDRFIMYVKQFSTMLDACRTIVMTQQVQDIDKVHIGEPITESAAEATEQGSPNNEGSPQYNKVTLTAVKTRSTWNISTETLQNNIEQANFEDTMMQGMTQRIATDLEMLSIQGDTTAGSATKIARLLNRLDGWDKQTENAHIVDVNGAEVDKDVFRLMKRALPKQYRGDPGLRWIMSDALVDDWVASLAEDKVAGVYGNAVEGQGLRPLGIPILAAELIPEDLPVPAGAATPAEAISHVYGPYTIVEGSNDNLDIDFTDAADATTSVIFTLTPGTLHAGQIANQINTAIAGVAGCTGEAVATNDNRLILRTKDVGVNCEVIVQDLSGPGADGAETTLGLDGIDVDGTATGGDVLEGSFIWLTNPQNFLCGLLAGTRMFTKFNEKKDTIENIVYNQIDVNVENLDAVVKAKNVRLAGL